MNRKMVILLEEENIVGTRIGIFDILYECDFRHNDGHKLYRVKCADCGFETDVKKSDISKAKTCKHVARGGAYINYKIRWDNIRLQRIFRDMKAKCYDKNNNSYRRHGAKGIRVCDEWVRSPELFKNWSLANGYDDGLTIDRINKDGGYSPGNCRWVTPEEALKEPGFETERKTN